MTHRLLLSLILVAPTADVPAPAAAPDAQGARIFRDDGAGTLVLDLAPMDLPANTPHHGIAQPPVATLEIPESGSIYGFRVQVVDSAGRELPDELIHHSISSTRTTASCFFRSRVACSRPVTRPARSVCHVCCSACHSSVASTSSRARWSKTSRRPRIAGPACGW